MTITDTGAGIPEAELQRIRSSWEQYRMNGFDALVTPLPADTLRRDLRPRHAAQPRGLARLRTDAVWQAHARSALACVAGMLVIATAILTFEVIR